MRSWALQSVSLALAAIAVLGVATPRAAAADRTFTLYGSQTEGWGFTNTTMSHPGPTITVDLGDNVTLTLNSTDGPNHNWFIDYDNDGTDDPDEPNSGNFQSTQITWNFTADRAGTFNYRCKFHPTEMTGTLVIREASPPASGGSSGNAGWVIGGAIIALIAIVAIAYFLMKRQPGASRQRRA